MASDEDEQLMHNSCIDSHHSRNPKQSRCWWSLGVADEILNLDREVLGTRIQQSVRQIVPEVVPDPRHLYAHR